MPSTSETAAFQRNLATLPLATYQAGEIMLTGASTTGRLLILKEGAVAVGKEGVEIAKVTEPGAVFGELSVLLGKPHTADVRALEASPVSRRQCGRPTHARPDSAPARGRSPGTPS
jgi:CRP/FNR family transcriptional regulator, cyclic AMP receptor protein